MGLLNSWKGGGLPEFTASLAFLSANSFPWIPACPRHQMSLRCNPGSRHDQIVMSSLYKYWPGFAALGVLVLSKTPLLSVNTLKREKGLCCKVVYQLECRYKSEDFGFEIGVGRFLSNLYLLRHVKYACDTQNVAELCATGCRTGEWDTVNHLVEGGQGGQQCGQ